MPNFVMFVRHTCVLYIYSIYMKRPKSGLIWRCITYDAVGRLVRCSNHVNADEYIKVLQDGCVQLVTSECGMWFMQDNAPIHRAKLVTNWMKDNNISCIRWPAYSPDLNPIEEVWSLIKRRLHARASVKSLDELDEVVQQIWADLSVGYIRSLYDSMPKRLHQCVKCKGHPIDY
jgi:hypothetical protein